MPIDRNSAQYITGTVYKPTQTSAPGVWDLDDQANNLAKNLWPLPPSAVQRSLRFNSADVAYLSRTPSVTSDRKTYTYSFWAKRGTLGALRWAFSTRQSTTSGNFFYEALFYSDDTFSVQLRDGSTNQVGIITTSQLFRDPSAWYHFVIAIDTTQVTPSNRMKLYVNGSQVTAFGTATYPSQNFDTGANTSGYPFYIGNFVTTSPSSTYNFDGYMSEVNFIDGQALTPSSFGETDQQTGVWIPKRYVGTYGTNGFRLPFTNNSSTTALGFDASGRGNNWTPNNFSVTPGSGNDSLLDVPSLYGVDTGLGGEVRGNYCTWNPLDNQMTLANGNLDASSGTANRTTRATYGLSSGKWYWEILMNGSPEALIGVAKSTASLTGYLGSDSSGYGYDSANGNKYNGSGASYGVTFTTGDIIGVALDLDSVTTTLTFYKNGVSQGIAYSSLTGPLFPAVSAGAINATMVANFGQRPFAYPAPTGYKALCTTNLPAPAIGQTSSNQADNHFAAVTYTGNNGTQTISTLGFQPDFVWIKNRTGANSHILVDSIRGAGKGLSSESTAIEYNIPTDFQSFNSNGFTVGYGGTNITNASANNYVAWCWNAGGVSVTNTAGTNDASVASTYRANRAAGFSIVSWTYNGAATIAHGLNAVPKFMIIRGKNAVYNWDVYHASIGPTVRLVLNSTSGSQTYSGPFNNTTPTSSVFSQGAAWYNNGDSLIGYIFAEIPGYSAFGSYTGNGSTDGPFVYTGFRPRWVLVKSTSAAGDWALLDTTRDVYNLSQTVLYPNATYIEDTANVKLDIVSNGFKFRSTIGNGSGTSYVYMAFAETPARLSTAR